MKLIPFLLALFLSNSLSGLDSLNQKLFNIAEKIEYQDNIALLVEELKAECSTSFEVAEIISYWITQNIAYDIYRFSGNSTFVSKPSAAAVLSQKRGICDDYAHLFQELCRIAEIPCYKISGYAKGSGYVKGDSFPEANHAWNIVFLNNKYWFVDLTWASGGIDGATHKFVRQLKINQIITDDNAFRATHLPQEPKWQLTSKIVSMKQFVEHYDYASMEPEIDFNFNFKDSIDRHNQLPYEDQKLTSAKAAYNFNKTDKNKLNLARWYEFNAYKLGTSTFDKDKISRSISYYNRALELLHELDETFNLQAQIISAISAKKYPTYRLIKEMNRGE